MKAKFALPLIVMLASCADDAAEPKPLDALERQAAVVDALRYLGEGAKVLAVCGESKGQSWYLEKDQNRFFDDGIDDGVIVFAMLPNGQPEILTRDVTREMIVQSEDGGVITRLNGREDRGGLGIWLVQYPSTGVTASYNLAAERDGTLRNIWTQNKPAVAMLPPRASLFISGCELTS